MENFNKLIERSYLAIQKRGLINKNTRRYEFKMKLHEELIEVERAKYDIEYVEELTDLSTVAIMQIYHLGYNFINEFKKVIEKNEKRAIR